MSYKNTVKLFASNFMLVWKQVLYTLICTLICALLTYSTLAPVIELFKENNIIVELEHLFEVVYASPKELALKLSDFSNHVIDVVFTNISSIIWNLIGVVVLGVFLPYLLIQMSFYNVASIIHQKATMNMDVPYFQNFVSNLWISIRYATANFVLNLPFLAIIVLIVEIYLTIAKTIISALVGLSVLAAAIIFVSAIKMSLYSYQTGYMVEHKCGPFVAFGKAFKNIFKRFWKVMSITIAVIFTIIFVNSFIMVFTFFAGSVVIIPATYVFVATYYLVVYLNISGERYYLGNNMIFNPVKYVIKKDNNLIETNIPEEIKEVEVTTAVMKKKKVPKDKKIKTSKKKSKIKK